MVLLGLTIRFSLALKLLKSLAQNYRRRATEFENRPHRADQKFSYLPFRNLRAYPSFTFELDAWSMSIIAYSRQVSEGSSPHKSALRSGVKFDSSERSNSWKVPAPRLLRGSSVSLNPTSGKGRGLFPGIPIFRRLYVFIAVLKQQSCRKFAVFFTLIRPQRRNV